MGNSVTCMCCILPGVGLKREGLSREVSVIVYVVSICESIL